MLITEPKSHSYVIQTVTAIPILHIHHNSIMILLYDIYNTVKEIDIHSFSYFGAMYWSDVGVHV